VIGRGKPKRIPLVMKNRFMKVDKNRAWKALAIGALISLPILLVFLMGESLEGKVIDSLASVLMVPAMILAFPLLLLAPLFERPDTYVLGAYFYAIPFLSVAFYAVCAYGALVLLEKKK
jgi:hypothetical protein